jgi:hypothetical protein
MKVEDETVAFVHIDTSYLAYGEKGEPGGGYMTAQFEKYNWDESIILKKIEKELSKHKGATYKIAIGHHPTGRLCDGTEGLPKIEPLL